MFTIKHTFGQHTVLGYDTQKHKFIEYFKKIYNTDSLNTLHLCSEEYTKDNLCDIETNLHKHFYNEIKKNNEFKQLYCAFIKDIHNKTYKSKNNIYVPDGYISCE